MLGFSHDNKFDPDGAVTIRAVKILLRENIPDLRNIVKQRIQESFDVLLNVPFRKYGVVQDRSVLTFSKEVLVHPSIQVLYGNELGEYIIGAWQDMHTGPHKEEEVLLTSSLFESNQPRI